MGDTVVEKNTIEPLEKPKSATGKKIQKIPDKLAEKVINECKTLLKNNRNNTNKKNVLGRAKGRPFSPQCSLDKVAQDIRLILNQLKDFQTVKSKPQTAIQLKIEQKEFFQAETAKKIKSSKQNQNLQRKQSTQNSKGKGSSVIINKLSRNSIKMNSIHKIKSGTISKSGCLTAVHSNQLYRNVPVTKSELDNFKHKIVLSANEIVRNPERFKQIDKEKVAKQVKNLMESALIESEHTHKIPVIDVGGFINQSLKLTTAKDFPGLKKIIEKKTKTPHSDTCSDSDWSIKSDTTDKIENTEEDTEGNETEKDIGGVNKKIIVPQKENKSEKCSNSSSPVNQSNKVGTNKKIEDNSKNRIPTLIQPVVQTLKTPPNNGYTNRGQSKTTGNLMMRQKSPINKNVPNTNQISQKMVLKTTSKSVANKPTTLINKPTTKQSVSEKYQKGMNQTVSNVKARSNSTLHTNNMLANNKLNAIHVENPAVTMNTRPPSANNGVASSKNSGGIRRGDSVTEGSQRKQLAGPTRAISAVSSKLIAGKKYSHFGMGASSHSYFSGVKTSSSATKRHIDPMMQLREEVNRAIRDKKTFTVRGNYPAVRKALLRRGWVEKYHINTRDRLQSEVNSLKNRSINELVDMMQVKDLNEICKKLIKSKLLGSHQVDLYWGPNYDSFQINPDKVKLTRINKFRREVFSYTSKQGLCDAARNAHWFNYPGLAHINHPRTYALAKNGETRDFMKDFRRTAAMSLLKWVVRSHQTKECKIISSSGKIPLEAFQFAANECYKMIIEAKNEDIDHPLKEALDHEWVQFLEYYYKILHIGNHFKASYLETEASIVQKSSYLVEQLAPFYPHIRMDGTMNIWILKPAAGSQGKGIHICRTLQYIMQTVASNNHIRYIAQKYIERPLLIFNTKFDIRQWFLISCALPLTIWMYKECYLRFSSQTYNLRKLHESIHLTNNSVQKHYQSTSHDITLPNYNMWDSIQFKTYLSNIGYPDIYNKLIYKGMKECIIGAVMIHQDKIDKRKNCFELYGADFMLTEDFQPWLIEINSSPALFASTPITARMCPQVLEDTIKVVVDHTANQNAKTGNFELIYKQPNLPCNNNANMSNMKVSGKPLPNNYFCRDEDKNVKRIKPLSITEGLHIEKKISKTKTDVVTKGVKETLENLLKFIQNEKKKRQKKHLVNEGTDPVVAANLEEKKSSCTCTSPSFMSLKSQLDVLVSYGSVAMNKEDVNMIDQALKILKNKKNEEVAVLNS